MAQFVNMRKVDLLNGEPAVFSLRQLYYADQEANKIGAIVYMGGEPYALAGTCTGTAIRADGTTVPMQGTVDGNQAYITLIPDCYAIEGSIQIFVKITIGDVVSTLAAAVGTVRLTETDAVIDPGEIIPSVSALITSINDAIASIPADYSALLAAIAPNYTDLVFPVSAGTWCWYDGGLHRAAVDIPAAETWTAAHWENAPLSNALARDVAELKSAFETHENYSASQIGSPDINITDLSEYTQYSGALGSNGTWSNATNANYKIIAIPVSGGHISFSCAANSPTNVTYAGVSEFSVPVNGESFNATESFGRKVCAAGGSNSYDIPSDVHYIVINVLWGGNAPTINNFLITQPGQRGQLRIDIDDLSAEVDDLVKGSHSILIIGDSYSYNTDRYIKYLQEHIKISNLVNLGVSSAKLKDLQEDRTQYPYDGRPVSNGTGNNNTFGNQIAKLQRLMAGTDLDAGETQIYTSSADYPDIILIEGGKNDVADQSDDYEPEMWTAVTGYSRVAGGGVSQNPITTYIPKDYEETNRTTFGGAMHYLYGALHHLFADAKIFFITPSGINYSNANHTAYMVKADQIRKAARYLCIPTINWDLEGRLSYVDNVVTGSGTQEDPYTRSAPSEYTVDSLHPNRKGGDLLGAVVCAKLREYGLIN